MALFGIECGPFSYSFFVQRCLGGLNRFLFLFLKKEKGKKMRSAILLTRGRGKKEDNGSIMRWPSSLGKRGGGRGAASITFF